MIKFSELLFQINNPGIVAQKPASINESTNYDYLYGYFFELIEQTVATHYVLSEEEDFEPTDDQLAYLDCVIEYAIANQNDPDIDLIVEQLCLDESIGSAIATATHGIQSFLNKRRTDSLAKKGMKADANLKSSENTTKSAGKAKTIGGKMRVGFAKARQPALRKKAASARDKFNDSAVRGADTANKRTDLANRIDSKVQSAKNTIKSKFQAVKDRVKSAIGRGAEKVGNFAGRVINKVT